MPFVGCKGVAHHLQTILSEVFFSVEHFSAPRDDTARVSCGNGGKSEFLLQRLFRLAGEPCSPDPSSGGEPVGAFAKDEFCEKPSRGVYPTPNTPLKNQASNAISRAQA